MSITKEAFGFPIIIPPHLVHKMSERVWELLTNINKLVDIMEMFDYDAEKSDKYVKAYNETFNVDHSLREIEDFTAEALEDALDEWNRFLLSYHVAS